MMSFRDRRLVTTPVAPAAVWLIGDIMETKGRQDLYAKQAPDLLKALAGNGARAERRVLESHRGSDGRSRQAPASRPRQRATAGPV